MVKTRVDQLVAAVGLSGDYTVCCCSLLFSALHRRSVYLWLYKAGPGPRPALGPTRWGKRDPGVGQYAPHFLLEKK